MMLFEDPWRSMPSPMLGMTGNPNRVPSIGPSAVPIRLLITTFADAADPSMIMPPPALPEITFRSSAANPPIVQFNAQTSRPKIPLARPAFSAD